MKKKMISVVTVIGLIFLVLAAGVITMLVKRYAPSRETMDGNTYFGVTEGDQAALIVNRVLAEEKLKTADGRYYVEDAVVGKYINGRFYWDDKQKVMLYTLPTEVFQIVPDTKEYQTSAGVQQTDYVILKSIGDSYYLDLEFIKQYSDMEYTVYENPNRVVIQTEWPEFQQVTVKKDSEIRQKGGIKSIIVDKVEKEETLYLQEEMENWSKVSTKDGYTGYIKKEDISEPETVTVEYASTMPEFTSVRRDHKINLGWHQVTSAEGNASLTSVLANTQGLNTISPTWFSVVDNSGTISSLASADYVNQAHSMGLEVWGLIDNFSTTADTLTFLSDTQARNNIINQLMAQADAVGLDGINLDFESITEEQGPHYVQFIRELSVACRNKGLVLSVDNPVPMPYTKHYDRKEQGIMADYVIIMGYDEHHSGDTEAGSVASLEFVKRGIEETLKEVPAEKVINAIPFYTRVWIEPFGGGNLTSEVLGMDGTSRYIADKGMDVYWDEQAGQNIATYEGEDALYTIWVEDEQSIAEKMKLIQENGLAGVAEWKLGFERASVWPVIAQYL
ncbi:MAG: glycosyl hydrolase family 18 protein [Bacillota bacterium]|nr:glycosyl hydrolase family 18 protein [Bacillota bacterium]